MEGYGFNDGDLEKRIVNRKNETFFQIHQKTVREFGLNSGFYWLLRYNAASRVTEWEVLPFENCRLGKPDDNGYITKIYYNPFFGTTSYDKKYTIKYDAYNPAAVKQQIAEQKQKFKGQVFFFGTTDAMSRFYPINEAFAAVKYMRVESGIGTYHESNIDDGFLQKFMLVMYGDPNAPSNNPEYAGQETPMTVGAEFEEVMSNNFMGAKDSANLWVQWVQNKEEKPEMVPVPTNANGDLFVTIDNQATKKITVAWKVPGILANIQEGVSLGGDANQIRVAVKLMQQRVVKRQRILTDAYQQILKQFENPYTGELKIVPYNPYPELEVLDQKIWDALTTEEKRQWIQENTEIDLQFINPNAPIPATPPQAKVTNAVPIAFPEKVRKKVQSTLDYMDKMQMKCGGKAGMEVANSIVANQSMGLKQLKRIHSYLKKNEQHANALNSEGCDVILYNAWGGNEMFDFLDGKLSEIDKWLN